MRYLYGNELSLVRCIGRDIVFVFAALGRVGIGGDRMCSFDPSGRIAAGFEPRLSFKKIIDHVKDHARDNGSEVGARNPQQRWVK